MTNPNKVKCPSVFYYTIRLKGKKGELLFKLLSIQSGSKQKSKVLTLYTSGTPKVESERRGQNTNPSCLNFT